MLKGCEATALAADGKTLGCIDSDSKLVLLDVASNDALCEKREFASTATFLGIKLSLSHMEFSPDGRYFLAGSRNGTLGFDVQERAELALRGSWYFLPRSVRASYRGGLNHQDRFNNVGCRCVRDSVSR